MSMQIQALIVFTVLTTASFGGDDQAYRQSILRFRAMREAGLKAEDSWLTLAGLHWLEEGTSTIGSGKGCKVQLTSSAPALVGKIEIAGSKIHFTADPSVNVTRAGKPFLDGEISSDKSGKADILTIGSVRMIMIKRGDRYALRVKDNASSMRMNFTGLSWFEVNESYRIKAKFEPAKSTKKYLMETIVGTHDEVESPGYVVFEREGKEYRMLALTEGDQLWIVFRDLTAGKTTSSNARQLNVEMPGPDGFVTLDFNQAVNLPCAYTPYATCPLSPQENRLNFAIEAGEKFYQGSEPSKVEARR